MIRRLPLARPAISIKFPVYLVKDAVYLFKFNSPDDFVGRVRGGLSTTELVKNSNIVAVQEVDSNRTICSRYFECDNDRIFAL